VLAAGLELRTGWELPLEMKTQVTGESDLNSSDFPAAGVIADEGRSTLTPMLPERSVRKCRTERGFGCGGDAGVGSGAVVSLLSRQEDE
jgi:hypothetical protein